MFCQSPAKKLSIVLDYSMHDQTLNRAKYTNYLGILLTSDLRFILVLLNVHINNKNKQNSTLHSMLKVYTAGLSYLDYEKRSTDKYACT